MGFPYYSVLYYVATNPNCLVTVTNGHPLPVFHLNSHVLRIVFNHGMGAKMRADTNLHEVFFRTAVLNSRAFLCAFVMLSVRGCVD